MTDTCCTETVIKCVGCGAELLQPLDVYGPYGNEQCRTCFLTGKLAIEAESDRLEELDDEISNAEDNVNAAEAELDAAQSHLDELYDERHNLLKLRAKETAEKLERNKQDMNDLRKIVAEQNKAAGKEGANNEQNDHAIS